MKQVSELEISMVNGGKFEKIANYLQMAKTELTKVFDSLSYFFRWCGTYFSKQQTVEQPTESKPQESEQQLPSQQEAL